jgi:hypothetical protein
VTPLFLLMACGPANEPVETADPTLVPGFFDGLVSVTWDGSDGLVAAWHKGSRDLTYTLSWTDDSGITDALETSASGAHVTGLADGLYSLQVQASQDSEPLESNPIVLEQLVGENRLVYLSQLELRGLQDLWGQGDVVVAAGGLNFDADLYVVDASDPTAPTITAQVSGLSEIRDVHLDGGVLYAASDEGNADGVGVWILDLSDPSDPQPLAEIRAPDASVHNLHFGQDHLFLASAQNAEVAIYDVADPTTPERIATWPVAAGVHDVTWVDQTLYVASPGGFTVLDVTEPAEPKAVLEYTVEPGNPTAGFHNVWPSQDGSHLFSSHEGLGGQLNVWRLSDSGPERVGAWPDQEPNCLHNVHVRDEIAYVSWYLEGVRIFDVTDPADPVLIGWYDTFHETEQQPGDMPDIRGAWGVWPYGDHVVVSDSETGLWWFDYYPRVVTAG